MTDGMLALFSVGLGWALGQGTAVVAAWRSARGLKGALLNELKDIDEQLNRVALIHARQLQVAILKGVESGVPVPVLNPFFTNHYRDAFRHLNRQQRLSYQLIHASLESLNGSNECLADTCHEVWNRVSSGQQDGETAAMMRSWEARVEARYRETLTLQWHIRNHLGNSRSPVLDVNGPMHRRFLEFQQALDEHVAEIKRKASTFNRSDFEGYLRAFELQQRAAPPTSTTASFTPR